MGYDLSANALVCGNCAPATSALALCIPACDFHRTVPLPRLRAHLLLDHTNVDPHPSASPNSNRGRRLRYWGGNVCDPGEPEFARQALLVPNSAAGRLDLWPVRKSQSLCGTDGDARASAASVCIQQIRTRARTMGSGLSCGVDGSDYFSFRFAGRHGGFRRGTGSALVLAIQGAAERRYRILVGRVPLAFTG